MFIGSAEKEMLVDNAMHEHLATHVADGRCKVYQNAMHELMMEVDPVRRTFLDDVDAFFVEKAGI